MSYHPVRYSCMNCHTESNTTSYLQHTHSCFEHLFPKPAKDFICDYCNIHIKSYEKIKFCSLSCSAKSNNDKRKKSGWKRSDASRASASIKTKTLTDEIKKDFPELQMNMETRSLYTPVFNCDNCGKYFYRPTNSGRRNCSDLCTHEIRSRKARSNVGLGTQRSKQEIELYNLCAINFSNVTSNTKMFDGWDADILLNDQKVAILWNGPWHYQEMNFGKHSLKQVQQRDLIKIKIFQNNGWVVEIFEDRYHTPQTAMAILSSKYLN